MPAVVIGIILGPVAANFLNVARWGTAADDQQAPVTLGLCRVVIGVQLVIAGFQLPAKFLKTRWLEMAICLLPVMTIMWLATTLCILIVIPNMSLVSFDLSSVAYSTRFANILPEAHITRYWLMRDLHRSHSLASRGQRTVLRQVRPPTCLLYTSDAADE